MSIERIESIKVVLKEKKMTLCLPKIALFLIIYLYINHVDESSDHLLGQGRQLDLFTEGGLGVYHSVTRHGLLVELVLDETRPESRSSGPLWEVSHLESHH